MILFGSIDGGIDPRKGADLLKEVLKLLTIPKNEFQLLIFGNKKKDRNLKFSNGFTMKSVFEIQKSQISLCFTNIFIKKQ